MNNELSFMLPGFIALNCLPSQTLNTSHLVDTNSWYHSCRNAPFSPQFVVISSLQQSSSDRPCRDTYQQTCFFHSYTLPAITCNTSAKHRHFSVISSLSYYIDVVVNMYLFIIILYSSPYQLLKIDIYKLQRTGVAVDIVISTNFQWQMGNWS